MTSPLRVLVFSTAARDALDGVDELEPVLVDASDPSTFPDEAAALVAGRATPEEVGHVLDRVKGVSVVQLLSAGVEHWLGELPEGVDLVNARGAHGGSTAEWAVTALLALRREIPLFVEQQRTRTWRTRTSPGLQGAHVVVLGAGDLGEQTRRRIDGFDARVTLVGRTARDGVRAMSELPELLPTADAVVVVVPLTDETRGMVDAGFLASMPDGAALVNAARGQVVDTQALLAELTSSRLRAALDVTDPEPLPADHPLWNAPGLLITPHVGGDTEGSDDRAWAVARDQLLQLAAGRRPSNTVGSHY